MPIKIGFFTVLCAVILGATPAAAIETVLGQKMIEGRVSVTPIGFKKFCQTEKEYCEVYRKASVGAPQKVAMSALRYDQLSKVNASVNAEIRPIPEFAIFNSNDDWKLPTGSGDCEDFVLLKQARLIKEGWPQSALLITVADMQDGTRHAVLTVRTDVGDLILDNVTDEILHWKNVNYRWIKRQSSRNMMRWVEVRSEDVHLSSSVETRTDLLQGLII